MTNIGLDPLPSNCPCSWVGSVARRLLLLAFFLADCSVGSAAELVPHADIGVRLARGFQIALYSDQPLASDIQAMTLDALGRVVVAGKAPAWIAEVLDLGKPAELIERGRRKEVKESAAAALSYVRSRANALGLPSDFYRTRDIHVHLPAGATPKDGPSAGIALATALVSALTGIPVRGDVAMTGEVTLRGRVLPIGGIREKGVAAHQHHVAHVIVPFANAKDLAELPEDARTQVAWHPVKTMDEVLTLALRTALPAPFLESAIRADRAERPT